MEDLIRALGHINFYLADADEIFTGRKTNAFDNERIRTFLKVEMLKDIRTYTEEHRKKRHKVHDKWFTKFRNCYAASVIPAGQL